MAKKRTKQAIPKRIGGVKIPKALRKGARQLMKTQSGKAMAAEALTALTATLIAGRFKHGAPMRHMHGVGDMAAGAESSASAFKYAIGEAVRSFEEAFYRGKSEADARAAWPEEPEDRIPEKKSRSGSATTAPH
jgi:hypothetical protein